MTKQTKKQPAARAEGLTVERIFNASPETLWAYWTDPTKFARWFNPAPGLDLVVHEYDVRVGGRVRFDMPQPDGNKNPQEGVFHKIEPYREIVSGAPDKSFLISTRFEPVGTRTRMTVTVIGIPKEYHAGATEGWNAGFDKLERALTGSAAPSPGRHPLKLSLPSDREILVTRLFDATPQRVFKAYTDPKAIPEWWGPRGYTTTVDRMDVRPGGAWRFVQHDLEGKEHGFHGVYHEVVPPEKLVETFEYEGMPGHVSVETVRFEAQPGGKTMVTVEIRFDSVQDRDGMIQSGMEWGMRQGMDRLEELLDRNAPHK